MTDSWEEHWRGADEDDEDKSNINSLSWAVYTKEKEGLIRREFLVAVTYPKGGNIFGLV